MYTYIYIHTSLSFRDWVIALIYIYIYIYIPSTYKNTVDLSTPFGRPTIQGLLRLGPSLSMVFIYTIMIILFRERKDTLILYNALSFLCNDMCNASWWWHCMSCVMSLMISTLQRPVIQCLNDAHTYIYIQVTISCIDTYT